MRVISGKFGGRTLKGVPSHLTRPTTDKVKESLFNMIGPYFHQQKFLDLFAGSGNVGIEAVSRGCSHATLIDRQYRAYKTILANVKLTRDPKAFTVYKMSASAALHKLSQQDQKFDLVYLDPPYRLQKMVKDLGTLSKLNLLNHHALVICETDTNVKLSDNVENYRLLKQRKYGITLITIYQYVGD
ncbi:16S rRNA (guanine(966)-N(2))-methyltransferase RsmD [Acetilactobacillus jinshanensis]|uniref:16S rRNA (Guanine(966)-N(2))-methyltransferase RsmD n=1 Tax=Acetilactobacillus jinshanensis TaxID=1720083 RepID=A0A4P6ZJL1_9LACO|nr:16S rRNA (guanine(966)-N(2))-methyltransferase RsmD [Acetilactobacillus jinshanensis]QBP17921.1 16S rRNA (guanine(966)-N(2))-methyltransferase RsmD [Acetilactobacillus jinshanensis]URL60784.1 16S rRNA (guanine(966)-N(2))-methyltransferase RsmD [uncultured bacterium]